MWGGTQLYFRDFAIVAPLDEAEYLSLLDWTARQIVPNKSGSPPVELPPLLERVGLKSRSWLELAQGFGELFHQVAGEPHTIASALSRRRQIRFRVRAKVQQAYAGQD
ncbi:MAG: hypothetical protein AB8B50_09685 [Pirellulaceae bacterium]